MNGAALWYLLSLSNIITDNNRIIIPQILDLTLPQIQINQPINRSIDGSQATLQSSLPLLLHRLLPLPPPPSPARLLLLLRRRLLPPRRRLGPTAPNHMKPAGCQNWVSDSVSFTIILYIRYAYMCNFVLYDM
ncbi:hypothetical protein ACP275_10G079500 [Erythranthe tilingii]